jgi:hypothetical protein
LHKEPHEKEGIGSHMGGMGNVVVNAVVRTLTRKAVGKAIKTAKPSSGKKKRTGPKEGSAKGKKGAR